MSGGRYSTLELKRRGLPLGRYHGGCSFGGGSSGRGVGYRRQLSRGTAGQPATVQRGPEGSRSACPLFLFCRWGLGACCISNTRTRNSAPTPSCDGSKAGAKKHATLSLRSCLTLTCGCPRRRYGLFAHVPQPPCANTQTRIVTTLLALESNRSGSRDTLKTAVGLGKPQREAPSEQPLRF